MIETAENTLHWYAARTRKDQELSLRDKLGKFEVEVYLPTRIEVRQLKYRKKKVEIPVIRNLIFVRTTKMNAYTLLNNYGIPISYLFDSATHSLLVVPERQMRDFMLVMNTNLEHVSFNVGDLHLGETVEIMCGQFKGIQGKFVSNANGDYVVIQVPQVFAVSVQVPRGWLKKV